MIGIGEKENYETDVMEKKKNYIKEKIPERFRQFYFILDPKLNLEYIITRSSYSLDVIFNNFPDYCLNLQQRARQIRI